MAASLSGAGGLVAIDVTGIVGERDRLTGIQRVIVELVPRLCRRLWARGFGVALVQSSETPTHHQWPTAVADAEVTRALTELAHLDLSKGAWVEPTAAELAAQLAVTRGAGRLVLQAQLWLRRHPQLRARLNRGRAWHALAQPLERLWRRGGDPAAASPPPPPPRALLALAGAIKPLRIPDGIADRDVVVLVHDLIPLTHPQLAFAEVVQQFRDAACALAHHPELRYVTPSAAMASDLRRFLRAHGQPDAQIQAIHWGFDRQRFSPAPDPEWRAALGLPADAFVVLSVSTLRDRRKRFAAVAEAIELCAQQAPVYAVFIGHDEGALRAEHERVRYLGYVDDRTLQRAYSSCDLYVSWSAVEGFGLPLLEALACGAPVLIAPDCAAQREVAGAHARLGAEATPAALADAILDAWRARAQPRGAPPDLSRFDWDRAAEAMIEWLLAAQHTPVTTCARSQI